MQTQRQIEIELGDRDRKNARGERMVSQEYWKWRTERLRQLQHVMDEYRQIKAQLSMY
jgi:hypothetical protein